jgi:hypothetical protein
MEQKMTHDDELLIRSIVKQEIDALKKQAFVDGNAELHKAMQQSELNSNNFWREIWSKIIITTAATGTGSIVLFLFYAVLSAIKTELKK